jgi:hypothetical protein
MAPATSGEQKAAAQGRILSSFAMSRVQTTFPSVSAQTSAAAGVT